MTEFNKLLIPFLSPGSDLRSVISLTLYDYQTSPFVAMYYIVCCLSILHKIGRFPITFLMRIFTPFKKVLLGSYNFVRSSGLMVCCGHLVVGVSLLLSLRQKVNRTRSILKAFGHNSGYPVQVACFLRAKEQKK